MGLSRTPNYHSVWPLDFHTIHIYSYSPQRKGTCRVLGITLPWHNTTVVMASPKRKVHFKSMCGILFFFLLAVPCISWTTQYYIKRYSCFRRFVKYGCVFGKVQCGEFPVLTNPLGCSVHKCLIENLEQICLLVNKYEFLLIMFIYFRIQSLLEQ